MSRKETLENLLTAVLGKRLIPKNTGIVRHKFSWMLVAANRSICQIALFSRLQPPLSYSLSLMVLRRLSHKWFHVW